MGLEPEEEGGADFWQAVHLSRGGPGRANMHIHMYNGEVKQMLMKIGQKNADLWSGPFLDTPNNEVTGTFRFFPETACSVCVNRIALGTMCNSNQRVNVI